MTTFGNRLPVGEGSRGGRWHDPEYRREYHRAWRASHPEYRESQRLRKARQRARAKSMDPADIVEPSAYPRPLPSPRIVCLCPDCACWETAPPPVCGFCKEGLHQP